MNNNFSFPIFCNELNCDGLDNNSQFSRPVGIPLVIIAGFFLVIMLQCCSVYMLACSFKMAYHLKYLIPK